MDVALQNGLTVHLVEVTQWIKPRRGIMLTFSIYPTPGEVYQDSADVLRMFYVQFNEDNPGELEQVQKYLGRSYSEMKATVLAEWNLFKQDPGLYQNVEFRPLFEYVNTVGIAT